MRTKLKTKKKTKQFYLKLLVKCKKTSKLNTFSVFRSH